MYTNIFIKTIIFLFVFAAVFIIILKTNKIKKSKINIVEPEVPLSELLLIKSKGITGKYFYRKLKNGPIMMIQIEEPTGNLTLRKASLIEAKLILKHFKNK